MKAREYSGPLGILAAGALGLSLLCSVSAMAMGDLNRYIPITLEPLSLVDLAVANFETAAALTEQVVTVFVPTQTLAPTSTDTLTSIPPQPTDTARRFVTITPTIARKTRLAPTLVVVSSRTPTVRPPTAVPTRTATLPPPPPTKTYTSPPTDTLAPPPTDTPEPPPTDTPEPPPTDTPEPPPTDTDVPATDVPTSVDPGTLDATATSGP